ncbi:MAG: polyphosphate polymerase domain-containing protein [Candidatus Rifleibacteriota bacterium]
MARIKPYFEKKFLVPTARVHELKKFLSSFTVFDSNGCAGKYEVLTLYFDSADYKCFYDKLNGEYSRFKLRLRQYRNLEKQSWHDPHFELKMKTGDLTSKRRESAGSVDQDFFSENSHFKYIFDSQTAGFKPVAALYYQRHAWHFPQITGMRITFDSNIAAISAPMFQAAEKLNFEELARRQNWPMILEIKSYTAIPEFLLHELNRIEAELCSFSKYANGILKLRLVNGL